MLSKKDLLGLNDMPKEEIELILETATNMKKLLKQGVKKLPNLQGKSVITLFYENSTRTRVSFELASKFMSAVAANISASSSSVAKGETLIDTGKTLDSMCTDVIIIRHPIGGAPALLAQNVKASVVNAGDGMNEHPSQGLLDMLTIKERFGDFKGLKVAIVGDIKHSRVAKSDIFGLTKMGADVCLFSPSTLMPSGIENFGAKICSSREEALDGANVVMGLRLQLERMKGGLFPSVAEYHEFYGINDKHLSLAAPNAIVMHPGPVNRGVELSSSAIDADVSLINEQVNSGVAVRMAILSLLTKK